MQQSTRLLGKLPKNQMAWLSSASSWRSKFLHYTLCPYLHFLSSSASISSCSTSFVCLHLYFLPLPCPPSLPPPLDPVFLLSLSCSQETTTEGFIRLQTHSTWSSSKWGCVQFWIWSWKMWWSFNKWIHHIVKLISCLCVSLRAVWLILKASVPGFYYPAAFTFGPTSAPWPRPLCTRVSSGLCWKSQLKCQRNRYTWGFSGAVFTCVQQSLDVYYGAVVNKAELCTVG